MDKFNSEVVSINIMVFILPVSPGIMLYRCFVSWPGDYPSHLSLQSPSLRLSLPLQSSPYLVFVTCKWFLPKIMIVCHCLSNRLLSENCQGNYSFCLWLKNTCPKFVHAVWWEMYPDSWDLKICLCLPVFWVACLQLFSAVPAPVLTVWQG